MGSKKAKAPTRNPNRNRKERKCLKLRQKLDLIEDRQKGISTDSLVIKYGITKSTVNKIIQNRAALEEQSQKCSTSEAKKHTSEKFETINKAVLRWFFSARKSGVAISGPLITEKALEFANALNVSGFKGSQGWLTKFLKRNNITFHTVKGEQLSANPDEAESFKSILSDFIKENRYEDDELYNGDETGELKNISENSLCDLLNSLLGLMYKMVPRKTFEVKGMEAKGFKTNMDRISIMCCSNKTGDHRLPLCVVGKSAKPRCLKDLKHLPVS